METMQLAKLCLPLYCMLMTSSLFVTLGTAVDLPCPSPCECYQKEYEPYGDVNTVACSNLGLTAVPDLSSLKDSPFRVNLLLDQNEIKEISKSDFPPALQIMILDLNQNRKVKMSDNAFLNLGYSLKVLSLEAIDIVYDSTLSMFDGLFSLEELYLNNNNKHPYTEGAVQNVNATLFQGEVAKHLKKLKMAYCAMRTMSENSLGSLTALEELDLSNNWFTSIPPAIKLLRNVNFLEFYYCNIKSLKDNEFSGLPNLKSIDLSSNPKLTTISNMAFSGCEDSLEKLNMQRCALSKFPTGALANLNKLSFLDLSENSFTDIGPDALVGNYKLTELVISSPNLVFHADMFSGQESNIVEISIPRMNLKTIPLAPLRRLTGLRRLTLLYNNITTLPENAFDGITASSIYLSNNPLSSIKPGAFNGMPPRLVISLRRTHMADIEFLNGYPDKAILTVDLEHAKLACRCSMKSDINVTLTIDVYGSCTMGEDTVHISSSKLDYVLDQACELEKGGNSGNTLVSTLLVWAVSLVFVIAP